MTTESNSMSCEADETMESGGSEEKVPLEPRSETETSLGVNNLDSNSTFRMPLPAPKLPGKKSGTFSDAEEVDSSERNTLSDKIKPSDDADIANSAFKMPLSISKIPEKSGSTSNIHSSKSDQKKKTDQSDDKPKTSKKIAPSPAEKLKQNEIPIPYREPDWGGPCEVMYSFEILKKGVIIEEIDLTTKSFHVFGRLPSCDITMEHPSLSRYHAVVQHCNTPSDKHSIGWYLYDLDSTHGTWINKNKIKPSTFYKLKVGHVIKFGGSTRLHILQV